MKYYLSSFKLGNETTNLKYLVSKTNMKFGYIPNALDFTSVDSTRRARHIEDDMKDIEQHGVEIEVLDLKQYFGKTEELKAKLSTLGGIYVSGGNTFVLRQAIYLSGLEKIFSDLQKRDDFIYVAYSAGVCVLTPSLKPYAITDDATDFPYTELQSQIWEGLGILNFAFEPHFDSDHPESKSTDIEIRHCIDNKILFKAYRDGEVLILE